MNDKEFINEAVRAFRALLAEQLARKDRLEKKSLPKDFASCEKIRIALAGGDGIGPIITESAEKALEKLLADEIRQGRIELVHVEGLTVENRLKLGEAVPAKILEELKSCDVILKGPTATPHGGTLESANVVLRRELDLYANVRPVRLPEKKIDWIFFRENSEGEYVLGSRGIELDGSLAVDFKVTTAAGSERIARAAFDYAVKNRKKSVTVVTKANILKKTDGLFSEVAHRVAEDYPGIEVRDRYIDIMTAELIDDSVNAGYEVFLLPNLYGDILTDEAAQIQGGVGTAGSSNIGDRYAMFEAIHGSAPRMIEEGLGDRANPASILRAAAMMLRHIARAKEAERLDKAIGETLSECRMTGRKDGNTCREFTEKLLEKL